MSQTAEQKAAADKEAADKKIAADKVAADKKAAADKAATDKTKAAELEAAAKLDADKAAQLARDAQKLSGKTVNVKFLRSHPSFGHFAGDEAEISQENFDKYSKDGEFFQKL